MKSFKIFTRVSVSSLFICISILKYFYSFAKKTMK